MLKGSFYNAYFKRIVDIVLALIIGIIFLPFCLIAAVCIKLSSPGPLLADVPNRIGKNRRPFRMHKFRSMVVNAHALLREDEKFKQLYEEYKNGSYKLRQDPRITPVGRYIRKHSIDEVPQLINVLWGEMSIVGPRAYYADELAEQLKKYPETRSLVKKVLSVRPGITGLWQVSGRSDVNFDKRVAIDAQYVDNMSLWQDIKIVIKTPWAMISGKGAI